jgi:hypothetical protein
MLTDIVDRLRKVSRIESGLLYSRRTMLIEAADEIERLRRGQKPPAENCPVDIGENR